MPIIDFIKDNAVKLIPRRRQSGLPMPMSSASGGIGVGVASFDDEVGNNPGISIYRGLRADKDGCRCRYRNQLLCSTRVRYSSLSSRCVVSRLWRRSRAPTRLASVCDLLCSRMLHLTDDSVAGLSGLAIFVAVTGMLLSATMLIVPVVYDKYDKLSGLSRAIREDRVHFILSTFGTVWLLLIRQVPV